MLSAFEIGVDVLRTVVSEKTKSILAQLGDVVHHDIEAGQATGAVAESHDGEWWQHVGFMSRPPKADAGKAACQAIKLRTGDHDAIIATKDLRGQELCGALDHGETCVYAPGADGKAQGRILLKKSGNVAIFTTKGNTPTGTAVTIQANADGTIYAASEYGVFAITSDGVKALDTNGAGLQLAGGKVTLIGSELALNGSSVGLGGAGGTGVATMLSMAPFGALLIAAGASAAAFAIAFNAFVDAQEDAGAKNAAKAAATALGAAFISAAAAYILPTSYSTSVKAAI